MNRIVVAMIFVMFAFTACANADGSQKNKKKESRYFRPLTKQEERVILKKGTERPFTGKYEDFWEEGEYLCKQCGAALYRSMDKFNAQCGWPSFDDEIPGAVKRTKDADGYRTEITCNNCGAHLGHVFLGEGFTDKNTRHCVNSISMVFMPYKTPSEDKSDIAVFAGGCFWGVEYYMEKEPGVLSVESGYIGGHTKNPTYEDVCYRNTGHAEAVRITFDPSKTNYESLAKLFFEIHDPTQVNRQGPDVGDQYRSEIFYRTIEQKKITQKLIDILNKKGFKVATKVSPATEFYEAETYHQDYYDRKGSTPYCHGYVKRF